MGLREDLESGMKALGLEVDSDRSDRLLDFVGDLLKWNKVYNLTAIRNEHDVLRQHLLDSLSISPHLEAETVIDVGTGGGFPGIPLSLFHPETDFVLLDSNIKKTRFLQQMVINHGLRNCEVVHTRAESYSQTFEVVVCRAFASLPDIIELAGHMVAPGGKLLAMKGQLNQEVDEIAENSAFSVQEIIPLDVPGLDAERHLIVLATKKNKENS